MSQLTSLSPYRTPAQHCEYSSTTRSSLSQILNNLPETVRNLEIDTQGFQGAEETGSLHLCPVIRKAIPQLQNLRLRLTTVCPEVCGIGFKQADSATVAGAFEPVRANNLRQLGINLYLPGGTGPGFRSSLCGLPKGEHRFDFTTLIKHLQAFVSSGTAPKLRRLWVLDIILMPQLYNESSYTAFVRRDIITNNSRIFPYRSIGGYAQDGMMIRMPDAEGGLDYVSSMWTLQDLAEGQAWRETTTGTRLPASIMVAAGLPSKFVALSRPEYQAQKNTLCTLWTNEQRAGKRLLSAGEREFMYHQNPIEEIPPGWRRL